MKSHKLTLSLVAAAAALVGCAAPMTGTYTTAVPKVEQVKVKAQAALDVQTVTAANPINYSNESWIPLRKIQRSEKQNANLATDKIQVEINQRYASLNEVAGAITSFTGLPVAVSADVRNVAPGTTGGAAPLPGGPAALPGLPGLPGAPIGVPGGTTTGLPGLPGAATPTGTITSSSPFSANYSGSLTGFLNQVAAYYSVNWKSDESGLRFFVMESKTFRIAALPGDTRLTSTVESASGGSASNSGLTTSTSGTAANSTGVAFTGLSVWTSLESQVKQMLSANGKAVASPATGTITVTDTPAVLEQVSAFVEDQNKGLNRQVSVNVRVLSVQLNDNDNYGINWDAVYSNLASGALNPYSIALKTAFPVAAGAGNLVLSAPVGSASRWAGSSAMISALSSQGRVSELTSSTLVTLNNQPAPVNVGRKISYLASSSSTQTPNVGSTTTLTPGIVQTGFSMTVIPHIMDGQDMLLQYSIDLSSLLQLSTISSGTSTIQTPDISTSNFIQRVRIKSGETLVVAGFDQDNLSAVSSGIGKAENAAFGTRTGTDKRTMLVVMIQPTITQ